MEEFKDKLKGVKVGDRLLFTRNNDYFKDVVKRVGANIITEQFTLSSKGRLKSREGRECVYRRRNFNNHFRCFRLDKGMSLKEALLMHRL